MGRLGPRGLLVLALGAAALWGGWWVVGSRVALGRAEAALAGLAAAGWDVAYDRLGIAGFPSRFDLAADGLALAAPGGGLAYAAPRVEVLALSYRPGRVIALWPEGQAVTVAPAGGGPVTVAVSSAARASARVALPSGELRALTVEGGGEAPLVTVEGLALPLALSARHVVAALRRAEGGEAGDEGAAYDLWVEAQGLGGAAPGEAEVRLDARAVLDRPIGPGAAPRPVALDLAGLGLRAGGGTLDLQGAARVAAGGALEGDLVLRARGWPGLLDALVAAGALDEGLAVFYRRFLDQAAGASGTEEVEVPIRLSGGLVTAMGLPVGTVPALPPPAPPPASP